MTVTWTAPTKGGAPITGYTVQWRTDMQTWAQAVAASQSKDVGATPPELQLSVSASEQYKVRVRASNSIGDGPWSADASEADTTAPTVSSAAVSEDGTKVSIVFDEGLDRSGSAPAAAAFTVTVGTATGVNPASVAFHATDVDTITLTMAATDTIAAGAMVTVAYDQPTSNALADAASNEVESFTGTDAITAPNRPATPVVTLTAGDGQLTAAWSAPANGGSEITGYDVEWKTAAQTWAEAATAGQSDTAAADATTHEITGLTNDTEYTVRVRAGNAAGDGPWSAEASETPIAGDTTAPEASSATVSTDGTTIDIVFDEDLDLSGSAPAADAFDVTVDGGTAVNPTSVDFHSTDADTITLTMAAADTIAAGGTVTVAYDQPTSNALADAASNKVESFTGTGAIAAPNRPAAPAVTLTPASGQITATWAAPANGGSEITGYDVEWKTAAQTWAEAATAGQSDTAAADATGHEITGLTNDTAYTVRVRAGNAAGDGPWSAEASETPIAGDTTVPSVDSATVSTDGATIDIVFDEDLDASGTAPAADAFDVTVDSGTAVNPDSVAFHATDTDTVVLTMSPAIAAGATVSVAYDQPTSNALADAASNEVADFTQAAPNRPAAPVVTLTPASGKLTAAWSAPANGGSEVTGYDVEWKTAAQTWEEAATAGQSATAAADATGHEITGLTNGIEHTVRVRAGNDAGDGPWSAEASANAGSADADLSALTVDGTSVEDFAAATTEYTVTVDRDTAQVTVAGTASDTNAGVEITPADADTSTSATGHQVDLAGGKTAVTVTVTAEDGTTTKDYTVNFHRPVVPHDWSLRPEGVSTGESFRVLIVTSTTRNAESGDIADYDAHVRSALANRGHADIRDYGPLFKALAATLGGAHPRSHTDTHPDDDGPGEEIWWLNGPRVADNYADFYDGTWDHSNPARTESGAPKTFDPPSAADSDQVVWTGTRVNGTRSGSRHLGTTQTNTVCRFVPSVGSPQLGQMWFTSNVSISNDGLGLYGLSGHPLYRAAGRSLREGGRCHVGAGQRDQTTGTGEDDHCHRDVQRGGGGGDGGRNAPAAAAASARTPATRAMSPSAPTAWC